MALHTGLCKGGSLRPAVWTHFFAHLPITVWNLHPPQPSHTKIDSIIVVPDGHKLSSNTKSSNGWTGERQGDVCRYLHIRKYNLLVPSIVSSKIEFKKHYWKLSLYIKEENHQPYCIIITDEIKAPRSPGAILASLFYREHWFKWVFNRAGIVYRKTKLMVSQRSLWSSRGWKRAFVAPFKIEFW